MSYIGITGNGPTYEYPFVEENAGHRLRPVVIKNRKVKGKRGWLLRRVGRYFAPDGSPEGLGHKALQVGNHLHELHTDEANQKYLVVQRLTGPQIWQSTIGESIKGYTYMTDQDVADHAMRVQSWMRGRQGGKYHVRKNNCHDFVNELLRRICEEGQLAGDVQSLHGSDLSHWTGSTITLKNGFDHDHKVEDHVTEVMPTPEFDEKGSFL